MTRLRANVTPPRQRPRVYICIHLVDGSYNFIGLNAHRRFPKRSWRIVCNDRASTPSLGRLASLIVPYLHRGHICFVKDKRRNGITTNGINFTFSLPAFFDSTRASVINSFRPDNYFFFPPKRKGILFPLLPGKKGTFLQRKVTGTHRSKRGASRVQRPDERQISNIVLHRAQRGLKNASPKNNSFRGKRMI